MEILYINSHSSSKPPSFFNENLVGSNVVKTWMQYEQRREEKPNCSSARSTKSYLHLRQSSKNLLILRHWWSRSEIQLTLHDHLRED